MQNVSPQVHHAFNELLLAELTLSGGSELPSHHKYGDTCWVQSQVITELLDPIDTYLILILGICSRKLRPEHLIWTFPLFQSPANIFPNTYLCICWTALQASYDPPKLSWVKCGEGLCFENRGEQGCPLPCLRKRTGTVKPQLQPVLLKKHSFFLEQHLGYNAVINSLWHNILFEQHPRIILISTLFMLNYRNPTFRILKKILGWQLSSYSWTGL